MPELPEVETVVRQLSPFAKGKKIKTVSIYDPKLKRIPNKIINGSKIESVRRKGKFIVLCLRKNNLNFFLAIHLRMTGRLLASNLKQKEKKHLRFELILNKGFLRFFDLRRFGTVEVFSSWEEIPTKGIDPTAKNFSFAKFESIFNFSKQPTKTWLMRQDKLIGVGNIYASEILFASGISPFKLCFKLNNLQRKTIYLQTKRILKKAIDNCGTTFSDFQDAHGVTGRYQRYLQVYDREGQGCRKCNEIIKRKKQGGRSTFYCSNCQR